MVGHGYRSAPGELDADIELPEPSAVALVDAAVHVARLVDSSNDGLMFPSAVSRVRVEAAPTEARGSVEVRRRAGNADGFVVDILVKAADGTTCVDIRGLRYAAMESASVATSPDEGSLVDRDVPDWSQMSAEETRAELQVRLQAILARELGMPAAAVRLDQPFPELGLDSMMAMTVLRDAKQLVGADLSATMLWNHPNIAALAALLTEMLAPQRKSPDFEELAEKSADSPISVLDALFDSAESVSAGSESGMQ